MSREMDMKERRPRRKSYIGNYRNIFLLVLVDDDASAGGAGAVPVTSDIINIVHSHFEEEEEDQHQQNETSHMSYTYGAEESRQHAGHLPEYSHQPNMPDLDENAEDNDVVMGTTMGTAQTGDADHDDVHGQIVSAFKQ